MRANRAQRRYERLLALSGKPMPETVEAEGKLWRRTFTFKHDFFAATGLYEAEDGTRAVLKIFRRRHYWGVPFGLLSRFQARHEEKVYRLLADTGHVPRWIGRYGKTGFLHEYVPGQHLTEEAQVPEGFYDQLEGLILTMHERGVSYLDTNKMHNVIVGDDGRFYLIDFQVTWIQPPVPLSWFTAPFFRLFKQSDRYHLLKQRKRLYPETIAREQIERERPWHIRAHRRVANPLRNLRRAYLRRVESRASTMPDGAERH